MPLASYFDPPLTTMKQDMPQIGSQAARMLLNLLENPGAEPCHLKLSAQLIIRQSTSQS
jgi:DNA-binding LacI/PurR family transcriptional regulator